MAVVLGFKRTEHSMFLIHASSSLKGIYIPDEEIILGRTRNGTFGGTSYGIIDSPELLKELKQVYEEKDFKKNGVNYSDTTKFAYDGNKLKELVSNAKKESELQNKVNTGLDDLLDKF